ncbi:hypothetical protein SAMD00019534_001130 [Acytostelium subglobosum LB1]|uniref:hypothetical protein n=1 Tax=Acytostelium subglobosum LB1 TaxID=1410327 RepID=UPI0006448DCD|nr:hypothetical protein SAMD00019534_001130 [Acytostelium subglobosum LB1]GAM16938.1 hypothetical protein SAMD00019534_001130 [Acytostelium subglobosum LB1]|eukprot:XP_012759000.1 hypothetical protein SAMD00019534_001130 [Acytostelium subglobosum LB1]
MTKYGEQTYWDERYQKNQDPFDWYQDFSGLKDIFESKMKLTDNILMVGCGNSLLTEQMYEAGYKTIVNVDISSVVIDQLRIKYKEYEGLSYVTANIIETPFSDNTFDAVIDKGTFDAIMCGDSLKVNTVSMCEEIYRILKPHGVFILVSYGEPMDRTFYLEHATNWPVEILKIPKPGANKDDVHYVYVMVKPEPSSDDEEDDEDEEDEEDEEDDDDDEDDNDDEEEENKQDVDKEVINNDKQQS